MALPSDLRYFRAAEFKAPHRVDEQAARFLDEVRHRYGAPLTVTSDARDPDNRPPGSSPTSLHLTGRAFDLRMVAGARRLWRLVESVCAVSREWGVGVELELVSGPADRHIHLGLQPEGRQSELLLSLE